MAVAIKPHVKIHYDYARYVAGHGTAEEKQNLRQTLAVMSETIEAFPGGEWEPMTSVVLIQQLVDLGGEIAAHRQQVARRQAYRDYQGKVGRSLEEESAVVCGQLAAQIMLGLPLGGPTSKEEARRVGNIGGGQEAFVPIDNPLAYHLIIDPKHHDPLVCWLIVPEGGRQYRLDGWITAGEAKQEAFLRTRQREGGKSVAYWVPPGALHDTREWWDDRR